MMKTTMMNLMVMMSLPIINITFMTKKMLMVILNLELFTISIIMIEVIYYANYQAKMEFVLISTIITTTTCETSILLMMLVMMNRKFSMDNLQTLNMNLC